MKNNHWTYHFLIAVFFLLICSGRISANIDQGSEQEKNKSQEIEEVLIQKTFKNALIQVTDPKVNNTENFMLGIKGIKNLEQYSKVLEFLKNIPEMTEVEVQQISQDQTVFQLLTKLSRKNLIEQLAKGPIQPEIVKSESNTLAKTDVFEKKESEEKNEALDKIEPKEKNESGMLNYKVPET